MCGAWHKHSNSVPNYPGDVPFLLTLESVQEDSVGVAVCHDT